MKKFWNWIRDEGGGRTLRLEGPIDEESFWGDEVTPKAFRRNWSRTPGILPCGSIPLGVMFSPEHRSIRCSVITPEK